MRHSIKFWVAVVFATLVVGAVSSIAMAGKGGGHVRSQSRSSVSSNKNVNVHNSGGYYGGGGCCYHDSYHPVATVATAAVTAVVVGSIVAASAMPPSCSTVVVNGFAYQQCGNTWYQPQMSGSSTTYVVVNPPR